MCLVGFLGGLGGWGLGGWGAMPHENRKKCKYLQASISSNVDSYLFNI